MGGFGFKTYYFLFIKVCEKAKFVVKLENMERVKRKSRERIKVTYKCVDTEAENQEKLDRVFGIIFDEVLRIRNLKTR